MSWLGWGLGSHAQAALGQKRGGGRKCVWDLLVLKLTDMAGA